MTSQEAKTIEMMSACTGGLGNRDGDTAVGRIIGAVSLWSWETKQRAGLMARKPEGAGRSTGFQLQFWTCRQEMGRQEMGTAENLGAVGLEAITILRTRGKMPGGATDRAQKAKQREFTAACGVKVGGLDEWSGPRGGGERLGRGSPCSWGGGQRRG